MMLAGAFYDVILNGRWTSRAPLGVDHSVSLRATEVNREDVKSHLLHCAELPAGSESERISHLIIYPPKMCEAGTYRSNIFAM